MESSEGSENHHADREGALKNVQWNSISESSETSSFNSKEEFVDVNGTRVRIAEQKARAVEYGADQEIELTPDGLPSKGSAKHASGKCSPCHYFNTKAGCMNGVSCSFCHMHCKETRQRPCKAKRAKAKSQAGVLDQSFENAEELDKVVEDLKSKGGYLESVVKSKLRQKDKSGARGSDEERPKQLVSL